MSVRDRPSPLNKFPAAGSFQRRTEIGELAVLFSVYSAVRRGGEARALMQAPARIHNFSF